MQCQVILHHQQETCGVRSRLAAGTNKLYATITRHIRITLELLTMHSTSVDHRGQRV